MKVVNLISVSFRSSILFNFKVRISNHKNHKTISVSFRSSILFNLDIFSKICYNYNEFPSPFGVQFFLILPQQTPYFIIYYFIIFVRILKIFIFLFFNNKKYTLTPIFKVSWRLLKKIIIFVFNFI